MAARSLPGHLALRGSAVEHSTSVAQLRVQTSRAIQAFTERATPGSALLVRSVPGAGKTTALYAAIGSTKKAVRVLVPTLRQAEEFAKDVRYRGMRIDVIAGRRTDNCRRVEVVTAASRAGFSVSRDVCGSPAEGKCDFRGTCAHYLQYGGAQLRVGTTEQLWNPEFMAGAELVFLDDPNWNALIRRVSLGRTQLTALLAHFRSPKAHSVRILLRVLIASLDRTDGNERRGLQFGAQLWDHLAVAAAELGVPWRPTIRSAMEEMALIRSLRLPLTGGDETDWLPWPNFASLCAVLHREAEKFESGREFNSQLAIDSKELHLGWFGRSPIDRQVIPNNVALCVLDATPNELLCDRLLGDFNRAPDLVCDIEPSAEVTVIQHVDRAVGHGSIAGPGVRDGLHHEISQIARRFPSGRVAAITYKGYEHDLAAMGFEVITWSYARGTNRFSDFQLLIAIGRPQPPEDQLLYDAMVVDPDGSPIIRGWEVRWRAYEGVPWEGAFFDLRDRRASQLLHWHREAAVFQGVHRSRLAVRDEPLEVHIFASTPIPGLKITRIEGLSTYNEPRYNDEVSLNAVERIRQAVAVLKERGETPTIRRIVAIAACSASTASKYRHLLE